jgi:tRNA nucleotidyltransferase/poly(A) polymerase
MRGRLEIVSAERIRDELDKLIVVGDPPPVL